MTVVDVTQEDQNLFLLVSGISPASETASRVRQGLAFTWEVEQIARHRLPRPAASMEVMREALELAFKHADATAMHHFDWADFGPYAMTDMGRAVVEHLTEARPAPDGEVVDWGNRVCKICDGGPGNECACNCGMEKWDAHPPRNDAVVSERAAIVAWLRRAGDWPLVTAHAEILAGRIEQGEHLATTEALSALKRGEA